MDEAAPKRLGRMSLGTCAMGCQECGIACSITGRTSTKRSGDKIEAAVRNGSALIGFVAAPTCGLERLSRTAVSKSSHHRALHAPRPRTQLTFGQLGHRPAGPAAIPSAAGLDCPMIRRRLCSRSRGGRRSGGSGSSSHDRRRTSTRPYPRDPRTPELPPRLSPGGNNSPRRLDGSVYRFNQHARKANGALFAAPGHLNRGRKQGRWHVKGPGLGLHGRTAASWCCTGSRRSTVTAPYHNRNCCSKPPEPDRAFTSDIHSAVRRGGGGGVHPA